MGTTGLDTFDGNPTVLTGVIVSPKLDIVDVAGLSIGVILADIFNGALVVNPDEIMEIDGFAVTPVPAVVTIEGTL